MKILILREKSFGESIPSKRASLTWLDPIVFTYESEINCTRVGVTVLNPGRMPPPVARRGNADHCRRRSSARLTDCSAIEVVIQFPDEAVDAIV